MKLLFNFVYLVLLALENTSGSQCLCSKLFDLLVQESTERRRVAQSLAVLKDELGVLRSRFDKEETANGKLSTVIKNVSNLQIGLQEIKTRLYGKMQKNDFECRHPVAFFARLQRGTVLLENQVVTYDTVISDTCGTFNKSSGIFLCPLDGNYVFNFNLLDNAKGGVSHLTLRKTGSVITQAWVSGQPGIHKMGGNSAILPLKKGDTVYITVADKQKAYLNSWGYATFSGFRLV